MSSLASITKKILWTLKQRGRVAINPVYAAELRHKKAGEEIRAAIYAAMNAHQQDESDAIRILKYFIGQLNKKKREKALGII